ncbi:MAG: efflux RND transporter periplasmic adaptor subunit [Anaerolineales bacterium]
MRRWWIIALVLVVLVAGFFGLRAYRNSQAEAGSANLQTEPIRRGELTASVGATGVVRSNQSAVLTFETNGTVAYVHQGLGDLVAAGELLASLEKTSLSAQIIMAEADLVNAQRALEDLLASDKARAAAQQALAQARDALDKAQYTLTVRQQGNRASEDTIRGAEANLTLADQEVRRAQDMYDLAKGDAAKALALSNLVAARQKRDSIQRQLNWYLGHPDDIEQAMLEADVAVAQARVDDAEREWERVKDGPSQDDIRAAQARVDAAQATLELARITAPFAGTLTMIDVKEGDSVTPGTPAFRLDDLSKLLVDVELSEVDINRVKLGQPVTLNFDAILDRDYTGEVTEIGQVGNSAQGVVNFPVVVELKDHDEAIKPGMTAAVNILVEQIENALQVPNRAVRVIDGQRVVYIMKNGQPTPVAIQLGASSDLYSEVTEGEINPGDEVVLNPPSYIFDPNEEPPFVQGMRQ